MVFVVVVLILFYFVLPGDSMPFQYRAYLPKSYFHKSLNLSTPLKLFVELFSGFLGSKARKKQKVSVSHRCALNGLHCYFTDLVVKKQSGSRVALKR